MAKETVDGETQPKKKKMSKKRKFLIALGVIAGLLVGVGTRFGAGCTSGHGVCGISRLSPRSMVATGCFMASGIITVYLTHHVLSGS